MATSARLSVHERTALAAFTDSLRLRFGDRIRGLTLFGSRARGEGRDDSDLDVLVRLDRSTRADRGAVCDLAFDVGLTHSLVISALVVDAESWRNDLPLARAVEREGVAL